MSRADLIEAMARAICGKDGDMCSSKCSLGSCGGKMPQCVIEDATAALDAIKAAGLAIMPEAAQVESVAAWYRYKNGHHYHDEPPPPDTSDVGAYRALIAAGRLDKEPPCTPASPGSTD